MTDDEREWLDQLEQAYAPHPVPGAVGKLLAMARRCDKAEHDRDLYLRDCAGFSAQGERDAAIIEGVRRQAEADVARECHRIVLDLTGQTETYYGRSADGQCISGSILARFNPGGGPTLTERVTAEVAQQCAEIAEQVALDPEAAASQAETIANAINELFGLTAGQSPAAIDAAHE